MRHHIHKAASILKFSFVPLNPDLINCNREGKFNDSYSYDLPLKEERRLIQLGRPGWSTPIDIQFDRHTGPYMCSERAAKEEMVMAVTAIT